MSDVRRLLEGQGARFRLPDGAFERLLSRRQRRARDRRIAAAVLALVVAAAGIGAAAVAFRHRAEAPVPSGQTITPSTVSRLREALTGGIDSTPFPAAPAAAGGLVFVLRRMNRIAGGLSSVLCLKSHLPPAALASRPRKPHLRAGLDGQDPVGGPDTGVRLPATCNSVRQSPTTRSSR